MECGGETEAGGFYIIGGQEGFGGKSTELGLPYPASASHSLIFTNSLIIAKMPVRGSIVFRHIVYCMVTYICIMIFI